MRKRRLPPLNALRGFEASARHLSFTKAAEELNLTQGAVSRQVQELEAYCGEPLFRRMTRRIELTPEGEQFFRVVEAMLDDLERAANRFGRRDAKKKLTITALPTIATVWLMPRLHLFTSRNPDIEVRIVSSIEPADLLATEAGAVIVAPALRDSVPASAIAIVSPRPHELFVDLLHRLYPDSTRNAILRVGAGGGARLIEESVRSGVR